jgi:hypothetical protein
MRSKFLAFATAAATIVLVGGGVYAQNQTTPDADFQARYDNQQFGFSFNYPADMTVSEDWDDYGAETITFNATGSKQFLVVVTPYSTVDLAGNAPTSDKNITAPEQGDTLSDVDVIVGDVVHILFSKNQVMYEIIGSPDDEPWLLSLLQTWRFQ